MTTYQAAMFDFDVPPPVPTITLTHDPSIPDSPTATKIGGLPYLPAHVDWPTYTHGPMMFYAQLNFDELPPLPGFPERGIVQFFGGTDEIFGSDDADGCFVRWIEDTTAPSVGTRPEGAFCDDGPFTNRDTVLPLRGVLETALPSSEMSRIRNWAVGGPYPDENDRDMFASRTEVLRRGDELIIIKAHGRELHWRKGTPGGEWEEKKEFTANKTNERIDELKQEALNDGFVEYPEAFNRVVTILIDFNAGHRVGGYPFFTQTDPRPAFADSIQLLQLDSDMPDVMWGDVGLAHWFISSEDLACRDFSNVTFAWDCY